MADITHDLPLPAQRPPVASTGIIGWLRANLFNSVFNTVLTLLAVYLLASVIPPLVRWGLVVVGLLMWGGILGLTYVDTALWSGLPLTLILAVVGMVFAFPFAILLALGRRSELPAIRAICVAYIELVRGVPLITVLFMASVMLPLFLPTGFTIDKLLRAQVAFILFAAAYLAEVVGDGLRAIPQGKIEAADAQELGFC